MPSYCTTLILDYANARLIRVKHKPTDDFPELFEKHFGSVLHGTCEWLTVE